MYKILTTVVLLWTWAMAATAQLTGVVVDKTTGDSIPSASLIYKATVSLSLAVPTALSASSAITGGH